MLSLAIVLCLGALASSAPQKVFYSLEEAVNYFEDFMKTYNKEYTSEAEKLARFEIFKNNLADINDKNLMSKNAVFGINEFTDLTQEEFTRMYTGLLPPGTEIQCTMIQSLYNASNGFTAPDSFDWRTKSKVTSVKAQGNCGSCWAFSTVGTIEGQYAIKYNQLIDLSPQQLMDCGTHTYGCDGGLMSNAILDLVQFGGIMSEQSYPYKMRKSTCKADSSRFDVKVTGCRQFVHKSEEEVKETLTQVGPLSIVVAASTWHSYHGGILESCDSECLNHAVLLVGYGSEGGEAYWIIKNSWGPGWGESGYIRMRMNKNMCNFMSSQFVAATVQ